MPGANLDRGVGRVLGQRYELEARIGSGASAEVYRAVDLNLGRSVAVKQLRADLSEDPRFTKLFRSEATLAAQLDHPNILTVFDWSADEDGVDGGAYIVTELVTGGTLRAVLDTEGILTPQQTAFIGLQVAQGLDAAHGRGLVHRDIKPANLLFGQDGRVRIGDFGIARAVAEAAWTEPEGVLIGTARYAAPEQAETGAVSGLVDVYSLAVCLIEALTGEVPLVGDNAVGTMHLRRERDLPVDDSFGVLAEPLAWAGTADPGERATAAEIRAELLAACRSLPDPEPVALIDLTETGWVAAGPTPARPNVRIMANGDLVIEGEDGSDLAIGAAPGDGWARAGTLIADDGERTAEGYEDRSAPELRTFPPFRRRDRGADRPRRRGWLVLGLLLAAVAAAGALAGGWYLADARDTPTETVALGLPSHEVGDYAGLTPEEVRSAVAPYGWRVTVDEVFADGTRPGDLLEQTPVAGEVMGRGGTVELVLSLGPERRLVPEMVGSTEEEVRAALEAVKLVVGSVIETSSEDVAPGVVMEATIGGAPAQPGTELVTGTAVDLVVSSGPAPRSVPPVAGLTADRARVAIEDEGLAAAAAEQYSESVAEGAVISVSPPAGTQVDRGSTVTITVSLGRPFVVVPDLAGRPVSEAIDELRAQGFQVVINGAVGAQVLGTRPVAGTSVRSGSEIEIVTTE